MEKLVQLRVARPVSHGIHRPLKNMSMDILEITISVEIQMEKLDLGVTRQYLIRDGSIVMSKNVLDVK